MRQNGDLVCKAYSGINDDAVNEVDSASCGAVLALGEGTRSNIQILMMNLLKVPRSFTGHFLPCLSEIIMCYKPIYPMNR